MWVRDILNAIEEFDVDDNCVWFVHNNQYITGNIHQWKYENEYLIGYVDGYVRETGSYRLGRIIDFKDIVSKYNVPFKSKVMVVGFDGCESELSNVSYKHSLKLFKSAV